MPESPEQLYARVIAAADADGRLPLPEVTGWEIFPWTGDLSVRPLQPPVDTEPVREGAPGGRPCGRCAEPLRDVIWANDRWTVSSTAAPTGMPLVLFLMLREHRDFTDLDDERAAELGRLTVRLTRIMERMPGIGRVHVMKWGDGAEHLHVWFIARPARMEQIRGFTVAQWDDILPPVPEQIWREDLAEVARQLATHEGRAL